MRLIGTVLFLAGLWLVFTHPEWVHDNTSFEHTLEEAAR